MAVVLADVVVVKRCKEEQATLHLFLYIIRPFLSFFSATFTYT